MATINIGKTYRPAPKWGVTDDEYDCWMLGMLSRWPAYRYEYNMYVVSRIKTEILKSLVPPEVVSKRRSERKAGKWARKVGLDPDDRRPDYLRSLTTFGDLFYGSTHGYSRIFKPERGRRYALSGSFVILWDAEYDMRGGIHPKCREVDRQFFYNALAATYVLVEEAEQRGDAVTLMVCPQGIDRLFPKHNRPQFRKAPVIPVDFQMSDQTRVISTDDIFEWVPNLYGEPNPRVSPDGRLPRNWLSDANNQIRKDTDRAPGMLSKYYYWVNSYNYNDIKEEILDFVWGPEDMRRRRLMHSAPLFIVPVLHKVTAKTDWDKRGTLIYITALANLGWFLPAFHYFREVHKKYECYIIDVGNTDWTMLFKNEPILLDRGVPIFNYINVNTLFKISVSRPGLIGFRNLDIVMSKTRLTISFNGRQRDFPFTNFSTAEKLERGIKSAFPTLDVERLTMGDYKMTDANTMASSLRVANGVITLTGYDIPNMTYKIMKSIGGMIDGISVT